MINPKVSVIIPIYNAERYLHECLNSILGQTLSEIEVICVDDGSTDSSADILSEYAKQDDRIVVISQQNQYAGVARNNGMQIARGEYVAFLDADDRFEGNFLERLYGYAKEYDLDVAVCRADKFDSVTNNIQEMPWSLKAHLLPEKQVFRGRDIERDFFNAFIWWPWDKLYKKEYLKELGIQFQPLRTTNDLYFVCVAVLMAERMSYINDVLVHQREDICSSLSKTREKSYDNFYLALLELRKFLVEHNLYERYEQDFVNYCLSFSLWHLDTMKGKGHCILYNALRDEWYDNLKVTGHGEDYFYDKNLYKRLCSVLEEDLESHLINALDWTREKLRNTSKELDKSNGKLKDTENKLRDTCDRLENTEKRAKVTENKLKDTENKLHKSLSRERNLKNSASFRIGRAITWGPRKIRDGVR